MSITTDISNLFTVEELKDFVLLPQLQIPATPIPPATPRAAATPKARKHKRLGKRAHNNLLDPKILMGFCAYLRDTAPSEWQFTKNTASFIADTLISSGYIEKRDRTRLHEQRTTLYTLLEAAKVKYTQNMIREVEKTIDAKF
jgi:hypothetical protein